MKARFRIIAFTILIHWGAAPVHAASVDLSGFPELTSDTVERFESGVNWTFNTIDALIGNNWRTSDGFLAFGGGSGSTLIMEFSVDKDITLDSYTIGCGLCLGNPDFDIVDQSTMTAISVANDTIFPDSTTLPFNGGPIALTAGTLYRFNVTNSGAAIQRNFRSWEFTVTTVPVPGAILLLGSGLLATLGVGKRARC